MIQTVRHRRVKDNHIALAGAEPHWDGDVSENQLRCISVIRAKRAGRARKKLSYIDYLGSRKGSAAEKKISLVAR